MAETTASMGLVKPTVNDKVQDTIGALAENFERLDKAASFVGMVVQSTRLVNPSEIYGGTWQRLEGRVLVGAGSAFPAGDTGGEREHALTVAEMPSHTHESGVYGASNDGDVTAWASPSQQQKSIMNMTSAAGGGLAHNNMPPYRSVYMWERVA